ncbi:hypothetical protein [Salarchaeum sp. JOR-1]|uniref:DUF7310 family coiled-coil domain-containing protein n=1 Tax=Salarchaeum sp. JOR-1 TaxID=2599399 RepID=UPI001198C641|nr:hypothetical protein [Salarchaeum sp. JOR-1]QDX39798.1 hypothetical protein FQU85_02375 [Salarchaeum sp. JOR-1]
MPDTTSLADRVRAVERALTDADELPDLDTTTPERIDALETRLDRLESALADLDADLQAVRGHVGELDRTSEPANEAFSVRPSAASRDDARPTRAADFPHPVPDVEPRVDESPEPQSLRERVRAFL